MLELRAVDCRPAIDPLTRKGNEVVTGASGDPDAYRRLLRVGTPRTTSSCCLRRSAASTQRGRISGRARPRVRAAAAVRAAVRQRKSWECWTHAASTTRSLLAASGTGSVRAKARLKDHLTAYCSALEGAGAESAEDQRDILLALLVENIRLAPGTPDVVAQELIGLRC